MRWTALILEQREHDTQNVWNFLISLALYPQYRELLSLHAPNCCHRYRWETVMTVRREGCRPVWSRRTRAWTASDYISNCGWWCSQLANLVYIGWLFHWTIMSKYAPHRPSSNNPRATSSTLCQKCLKKGVFLSFYLCPMNARNENYKVISHINARTIDHMCRGHREHSSWRSLNYWVS